MVKKALTLLLAALGIAASYLLHFPLRLLEDAVMGWLEGKVAENPLSALGFFITWVLPFVLVFGAIWLACRLSSRAQLATPSVSPAMLSDKDKHTVTELLRVANILEGELYAASRTSREFGKAAVERYEELSDNEPIKSLRKDCERLRAEVFLISPELSEKVRKLLMILDANWKFSLVLRTPLNYERAKVDLQRQVAAVGSLRKDIQRLVEQLIGGNSRG